MRVNHSHETLVTRKLVKTHLLRRESIGNAYHVLTFDAESDLNPSPGQFTMIRSPEWGQAPLLSRPMSFLSGAPMPSLLVKVCGEGSARLGRAEAGEPFLLLGPLGTRWRTPDPSRRQVLVAGGVGIAPLVFLAKTLEHRERRPLLLYGGRTQRDLPLCEDAAELCEVKVTTEDGSLGHRGRVTDILPQALGPDVEVYTCGPDRMMAAVARLCVRVGVPCEVSLEAPMACGYGVCLGCAVPAAKGGYIYACVSGPCIDAKDIDWDRAHATFGAPAVKVGAP